MRNVRRRPGTWLPTLHRWVGATLALWLVLMAGSGALLLFADDWVRWRLPDAASAPAPAWPEADLLAKVVAAQPGGTTIGLPRPDRPLFHTYPARGPQRLLDGSGGEPLATWGPFDALPAFLFDLHAHLLAGDPGHTLLGVLGLGALLSLLTGPVLWWRKRRALPLTHLTVRETTPPEVLRSHAAQGTLAALPLAVLVLSGVAMIFPGPFRAALDSGLGRTAPVAPSVAERRSAGETVDWSAVLAGGQERFPEARLRFVTPPRTADAPVVLRLKQPEELHPNGRSYLVLDPGTGTVLEAIDARERGLGPAVFDALYPIHSARVDWPGYRWAVLLASIVLLRLCLTGGWLFVDRRRRMRWLAALRSAAGDRSARGAGVITE